MRVACIGQVPPAHSTLALAEAHSRLEVLVLAGQGPLAAGPGQLVRQAQWFLLGLNRDSPETCHVMKDCLFSQNIWLNIEIRDFVLL